MSLWSAPVIRYSHSGDLDRMVLLKNWDYEVSRLCPTLMSPSVLFAQVVRKCKNPEKCWQLRLGYVQWALEVRPWGLHYCESIITIQILLIFKARVKDASCIQYIMNRQEQFCVEKKTSRIEMPNRFEDNHLCWNKARRSPRVRITLARCLQCCDNTYYTVNWVLIVFLLTPTVTT